MKVLIVGAGMAGLTCAATLDKNKYEITVIDKTDTFGTIGYAVAIWSNGFKVLEKMSIFKKIENKVNIIKHDIISDDKKNFISEIDFNDLRLSYDMGVIKRSDLHNALVLSLSKNINVRMNTVLDKIENTNSGEIPDQPNNTHDLAFLATASKPSTHASSAPCPCAIN